MKGGEGRDNEENGKEGVKWALSFLGLRETTLPRHARHAGITKPLIRTNKRNPPTIGPPSHLIPSLSASSSPRHHGCCDRHPRRRRPINAPIDLSVSSLAMLFTDSQSHVQALLGGVHQLAIADGDAYDFIIVGGGTAGLVLANRLTEDANISVVVLEAGECLDTHPRVKIPALYATLLGSDADWDVITEPQPALNDRKLHLSQGRAVGGSSAINCQIFCPTSKFNLDAWGALGNKQWDWETLAPYFKRCHTLVTPSDPAVLEHLGLEDVDNSGGGSEGPINVSYPDEQDDSLPHVWIETLEKLGYAGSGDVFNGNVKGVCTVPATIDAKSRERSFASSAYFQPAEKRPNLTVITGAQVQRILLTGSHSDAIATGVEYVKGSKLISVRTKREVILSAGSLHSPRILELSGIGNPSILEECGIRSIIENPNVGENMQDHLFAGLSFEVRDGVDTLDDLYRQEPVKMQDVMKAYATERKGPLAAAVYSFAFIALPEEVREEMIAKLERVQDEPNHYSTSSRSQLSKDFLQSAQPTGSLYTYAAQGNFTGSPIELSDFLPGNYWSIDCSLLQPLSRGSTHITSSSPSVPSKTDPNYFSHPLDLEILALHVALIARISNTTPLKYLLKTRGLRNAEAPKDICDPAALEEYVRATAQSAGHVMGTCAMLPRDEGGVVDERLKVWGSRNVRVVDASVFPLATTGLPMATVYAVAERAADMIKEDLACSGK